MRLQQLWALITNSPSCPSIPTLTLFLSMCWCARVCVCLSMHIGPWFQSGSMWPRLFCLQDNKEFCIKMHNSINPPVPPKNKTKTGEEDKVNPLRAWVWALDQLEEEIRSTMHWLALDQPSKASFGRYSLFIYLTIYQLSTEGYRREDKILLAAVCSGDFLSLCCCCPPPPSAFGTLGSKRTKSPPCWY